ncbi:MAG: hypothetical protein OQJ78_03650 [Ignavibacteriaceae bacterium]|nr:hypothetical protein [Ignavibacteriaceae bacterium]
MLFRKKPKVKRPLFRKIINSFLGIGVGLIVIFLVAFGYTQTSSFRNWLQDFVVEQVNSSTNGKLTIEQLDGTIFTTLVLSNTTYIFEKDTLLTAEKIEIKISPLRVLLKTIYVRKLEIENANISLLKDENGVLNLSKITNPPEEEVMKEVITETEPFNWKINVSELNLKKINFKHQSLANKNSTAYYPQPEMNDFRLENLNLSLTADVNIAANEYQLDISGLSVKPNLTGFNLLNLSGKFILWKDIAGIVDLNIVTERSTISLDAAASDFSPFNNDDFNIAESPIKLELNAENINFDDLTNFIDGTDILKGNVKTYVSAEGTLNELKLNRLEVKLAETSLSASGFLQNITDGDLMNINVNFINSFINQDDVTSLLPSLDIPTYKEYGVLQFDSLSYSGKPLDFAANMLLKTDKGKISGLIKMDLSGEEILYDYQIKTNNLDLMPVAGINTKLNLVGNLRGKGFSPENLETSIQINAGASTIQGISFKEFNIDAGGSSGIIKTDVSFKSLETQGRFDTEFDFSDSTATKYNFDVGLNGFNIGDLLKESEINSNLNISLKGDGENFGQDNLNLFAILQIDSSRLNEIELDSTVLIADVRSNVDSRVINIISDLADLTITGQYTIPEMINLITDEVSLLSSSIKEKIAQIQPPQLNNSEPEAKPIEIRNEATDILANKNMNVQYLLELKSFELISLFLGNAEIEIDGEISGKLFSSADTTFLNLETKINQMRYWDGLELYFLSDFDLALSMTNGPSLNSFEDFFAELKVNSKRIFTGSEITDLHFGLNFNKNEAQVDLRTVYNEMTAVDLSGTFSVNDGIVEVLFKKLQLKYKDFELQNSDDVIFSYSNDNFNFDSFVLYNDGGKLDLKGQLSFTSQEDLALKLSNLNLKILSADILQLPPEKVFNGELNLDFAMTGTAENPIINLSYYIDSIKVQNYYLGSLESSAKYSDKMLKTNFSYLERKDNQVKKSLGLEGTLPIDLSFYAQDRFTRDQEIDLTFNADNFDLRFASSFIPGVRNLVGSMNGSVKLAGYFDDIKNSGELKVDNSSFVLELSNLTYLLNARLEFQNDKMILSNMDVRNESKVKDAGTMIVSGQIDHENLSIQKIDLRASGSLKILDQKTKAVNPALYGDIAIKTREDIVFLSSETRTYLGMDLILKDGASITYSPTQSAFTNENDKFTYIFTSEKDRDILEQEIDSLLILSELKKEEQKLAGRIPFNFDLKLEVEKEAKVVFVLSREFKQNLTAYLGGKFEYSVINEIPFARGELTLLDGSKLDFIKTFQAKGNIRFIEELNNPFINVVATYESFYNPDTLRTSTNEYDVQIRIKLEGTADEITGNFLKGENNIEVYKSRRNANQFELDASKSASDAMFFVIVNKFPEDASIQETNLAASTAASLAGSIVGAVLNEKLGDVVRSVNVQQVGTETVFSLVGKVEEFRYEIGGTSQVFQDLTRATVKIEHPIFTPNFVVRFYRTEPPYQSSTYSEMINELGLKYTFVF